MSGLIGENGQPVDAGFASGVTMQGTGGYGQAQPRENEMLGFSSEQWMAISAMLNAVVLALTLVVMLYEM